jgi:hypothetical protein
MRLNTFASIRDALGRAPFAAEELGNDATAPGGQKSRREPIGAFYDILLETAVLTGDGWQAYRDYHDWLDQEIARLEPSVTSVWMELWGHLDYQKLFRRFFELATRKPTPPPKSDRRFWLAVYRALEPLGAAEVTHGMELSWEELHLKGQLETFLRAALRRERLMLERSPDIERANQRPLPDGYYEELYGFPEEDLRGGADEPNKGK